MNETAQVRREMLPSKAFHFSLLSLHAACDGPYVFTANWSDYRYAEAATYQWECDDPHVVIVSPHSRTTEIRIDEMPSWRSANLCVTAQYSNQTYCSELANGMTFGTNTEPQVSLSITAPRTIFANDDGDVNGLTNDFEIAGRHADDDDIVPVKICFHSDMATNGTLRITRVMNDERLWRSIDRDAEVYYRDTIPISECADLELTYYLEGDYGSLGYRVEKIVVEWQDTSGHAQEVEHAFTVVSCVAEPITSEMVTADGQQYVVNPCCAIIGSNTYMRIRVTPDDVPNSCIRWRVVEGAASFPNGNTGRDVVVVAHGHPDEYVTLEVDIDGCVGRRPQFVLRLTEMHEVTIYPYLITGTPEAHLTRAELDEKIREVNVIYRQVGLHFSAADIEVINNKRWSKLGLSSKRVARSIYDYTNRVDGVDVYYIGGSEELVDFDHKAVGRANTRGIIILCSSSGRSLAHELGHVCGLTDIYVDENDLGQYASLRQAWMPEDWSNGTGSRFYAPGKCLLNLIPDIMMFGVKNDSKVDIPLGSVRGYVRDANSSNDRTSGQAAVGRAHMQPYPPHTR